MIIYISSGEQQRKQRDNKETTKRQQTKLLNRQKQNMQLWRNWHTRKTKDLVSLARTGSSPVNCIFLMHIIRKNKIEYAVVAELAYAHDSGSCPCTWVGVQVPSTALQAKREAESLLSFWVLSKSCL